MKITKIDSNITFGEFRDPLELHEYMHEQLATDPERFSHYRETSKKHNSVRRRWSGNKFLEESFDYLKYGNKEYTADFAKTLAEYRDENKLNDGFFMDHEGFAYDMGSVINGDPDCCINQKPLVPKKEVDILFGIGAYHGVDAETIKHRGLAILNLVASLQQSNYTVNLKLVGTFRSGIDRKKMVSITNIPVTYSPISTMAAVTSTDFFRNIKILLASMLTEDPRNNGNGQSWKIDEWGELYKPEGKFFYIKDWYEDPDPYSRCKSVKDFTEDMEQKFTEWAKENLNG